MKGIKVFRGVLFIAFYALTVAATGNTVDEVDDIVGPVDDLPAQALDVGKEFNFRLSQKVAICVAFCRWTRETCTISSARGIERSPSKRATNTYCSCTPSCFFAEKNKDESFPTDTATCTNECVIKRMLCLLYSSEDEQGMCLRGGLACKEKCESVVVKRGGCADCEGEYDHCILVVRHWYEMVLCQKEKKICKRNCNA